ncbi:MAG: ABC transporter permease subunit [Myxococcales bacterium]|nr:ABC transporter permease subunit [Myxococcales bacterium]MDH3482877.1 ABC transporter permease subunit [Myxococcales bacterium]
MNGITRHSLRALALVLFAQTALAQEPIVTVGSKKFTESVILGELLTQLAASTGAQVEHRSELGGTRILWSALKRGEIDAYPEYTGTISKEILTTGEAATIDEIRDALKARGMVVSEPLGFNNTYILGMKKDLADERGIRTISDLARHPDLRFGFSSEFMDREDGWPGLRRDYDLPQRDIRGMDHDLAYRGLAAGSIDVVDFYSTDAEIEYYGLRALEDDRAHFPRYDSVIVYRDDLEGRAPEVVAAFSALEHAITAADMTAMNAAAKIESVSEARIASEFLERHLGVQSNRRDVGAWERFWVNTAEHLFLVAVSLAGAILVSIPLGVIAARFSRVGQAILGTVGIIQTIPALALLVFMIPLLGIGAAPAIVALFLYSLLPIVRNTYAGLHDIPRPIVESAIALGLSPSRRLRLVELPLAARSILAGIKTSAVINVGTATLGALIGTGGYGQPILTGIRLDDLGLIMQGAVPAAGLALLCQAAFEIAERRFVSKGLRIKAS